MSGRESQPLALITGGAGFVGVNLAQRLLAEGGRVLVLDNLSRPGVERNLRELCARFADRLQVEIADVTSSRVVRHAVERASEIYHFAAQVAVTTSLESPMQDFDVNARGTLNVLEAARTLRSPPPLIFTSTNKVYGALEDIELRREPRRYVPVDPAIRANGIDERRPLDFHSPYGCSKGAADQYVLDYARCFGLPAVVFRMSCIYGPYQRGTEDQGWLAHFLISARERRPLTIFGDGAQVRDVLYIDDLVEAFVLAREGIDRLAGRVFNIGGGPENTLSLLELLDLMETDHGLATQAQPAPSRSGDQRYYVSNIGRFAADTGWKPRTPAREGIANLLTWLRGAMPRPDGITQAAGR